jgi:glycosyl hydrolase family 57
LQTNPKTNNFEKDSMAIIRNISIRALLIRTALIFFILILSFLFYVSVLPRLSLIGKKTDYKVHVAYGFHVNLYHSYRIDTNNEEGFGKDIRIIRKIIDVLDRKNQEGIPVKGIWDSENLFSLQEQLPRYAPDIIEDIKRRSQENNDEVILMSYNNALASALTPKEFKESMQRAVSNSHGSGVKDLFGDWSPFVRPQEMMVTPGNYDLYKKMGIKGICLYYSAVTFDAFRAFARELTLEEAHNPITYVNRETGEKAVIIPTYNHGDMIENTSIKRWVRELHREQLRGNIKNDVLLFFNTDADAEYWYGYDLPERLAWMPNTGGLEQSIDSIKDLDYVRFTNLSDYLKDHPPVSEVSFGQDTADGSFNGYVSWAEKAYSHDFWSAVVQNRRLHTFADTLYRYLKKPIPDSLTDALSKSFEKRMRLQSTTNFGLATPFLARTRERVVESVIEKMVQIDQGIQSALNQAAKPVLQNSSGLTRAEGKLHYLDSFLFLPENLSSHEDSGSFLTLNINDSTPSHKEFFLKGKNNSFIPARRVSTFTQNKSDTHSIKLFVPKQYPLATGNYSLYAIEAKDLPAGNLSQTVATTKTLRNRFITVDFSDNGTINHVNYKGKNYLEAGSFIPKIRYGGKLFQPDHFDVTILNKGSQGVASVQLNAELTVPIPGTIAGNAEYQLTLVEELPYLLVSAKIQYPETPMRDVFKPHKPLLARKWDSKWEEVIPLELAMSDTATRNVPFKVLKRNYLGIESSYLIDYFKHSSENLNLSNINNHITAEYVGVAGEKLGLAVSMDTTQLSNFAFSPLKMSYSQNRFSLKLNPFGTYFGKQVVQPTWGDQIGYDVALVSADQYASSASTYNGHQYQFGLMISFFQGRELPEIEKKDLISYARPPFVVINEKIIHQENDQPVDPPKGLLAVPGKEGVYFHWERPEGNPTGYKVYCGTLSGKYDAVYKQNGNQTTVQVLDFLEGQEFELNESYFVTITAVNTDGTESKKSSEIEFTFTGAPKKRQMNVPINSQLRILWATLLSYID